MSGEYDDPDVKMETEELEQQMLEEQEEVTGLVVSRKSKLNKSKSR